MWDVLIAETQREADIAQDILLRAARGEEGPGMNSPDTIDEMRALHESMGGRRPKD